MNTFKERTMATTQTLVQDRIAVDRPKSFSTTGMPAGHAHESTAVSPPRRSTSTVLLRLSVAMVVVVLVASLLALSVHVPDTADVTTLDGPAVVAGLVAMYSMIAAFALAFTAAVRREEQ